MGLGGFTCLKSGGAGRGLRAAMLLAAVLVAGAASAQPAGTKLKSGVVVPNFEGIWERPPGMGIRFAPDNAQPPYVPEYAARFKAAMDARARGEEVNDPTSKCLPPGMPRIMVATYPLEILQNKNQVTIIAEWSSQVRRIFTDGRPHPDNDHLDPTFNGHSIGKWEGQTLAVDTVGIHGHTSFDATPLTHSDQMTVKERFRLLNPNLIEDQITVTDPVAFTKPWVVTRTYARGAPKLQIMEYVCEENNRDVHQTTTKK
jgi:hypothetical protein